MRPLRVLSLSFLLTTLVVSAASREFNGEIEGALYHIVAPEGAWNGSLWIEAHGLRDEGTPLVASLGVAQAFNTALLGRGWAIATTSYRRNGILVDDALKDIVNLRDRAASLLGRPQVVVVEGSSMGGAIVALLAEHNASGFTGAVAVGAALHVVAPGNTAMHLGHAPRIPVLFLTNRSEFDGPAAYVERARKSEGTGTVQPVLWKVLRDGHVNVNAPERLAAVDAVVAWAETGVSPGDRDDATVAIDAGPPTATFAADGSLQSTVTDLVPVYGNLSTGLQPSDFERLGIAQGEVFTLAAPGGAFRVLYGKTYSDVPEGGWIAFPTAEGRVMLARNHANAAGTAKLSTGDTFTVIKTP